MEFKTDIDDTSLLIRGNVESSFDRVVITDKTKTKCYVYVHRDKHCIIIHGARCMFEAGLAGFYKHVAAVLFHVIDHQR